MDEVKRPKGIKARVIISIFAISLVNGLQHVLSPVLSSVRDHYPDISVSMIQMLVTTPMLIAIVFALLTGWIALYISKKKIFLFAAASDCCSHQEPSTGSHLASWYRWSLLW